MLEGFDESDLALRSTEEIKQQKMDLPIEEVLRKPKCEVEAVCWSCCCY